MTYAIHSLAEHAHADPRRSEPIRFLVRSGVLPSRLDDEFWRCLRFVAQARELGLSVAEIRQLCAVVRPWTAARGTRQMPARLPVES